MNNRSIELEATLRLALEQIKAGSYECAMDQLEEALAKPAVAEQHKQEPVAWMTTEVTTGTQVWLYKKTAERYQNPPTPLFTAPPQRTWVGLTDEEVNNFVKAVWPRDATSEDYIRAIEAKLKEKNTSNGGCV